MIVQEFNKSEYNKLCAEFLGWSYSISGVLKDESTLYKKEDLKFDSDWNWINKMVEAIESTCDEFHGNFEVHIVSNCCTIQGSKLRIDSENPHNAYFNQIYSSSKEEAVTVAIWHFLLWYKFDLNKMKKELTIEIKKSKFFAQYLGTKTLNTNGYSDKIQEVCSSWNLDHESFFLELKNVSDITDEDAVNLAKVCWFKYPDAWTKENGFKTADSLINTENSDFYDSFHTQRAVDFLRKQEYALPYLHYSVEDLVSFGWVKLIEPSKKK